MLGALISGSIAYQNNRSADTGLNKLMSFEIPTGRRRLDPEAALALVIIGAVKVLHMLRKL